MAWLTSLLKRPASEPVDAPAEAFQSLAPEFSGPPLAVLVPDTAGISSFRLAFSPDAASAADYIGSLRVNIRSETHAFWALTDKPVVDESIHVEALVLIRAHAESDLVYVVSFLDVESALSFTRFEVRRGLHMGNVMIYWAAFAQLREELDGVSITPAFPPAAENSALAAPPPQEIHMPIPEAPVALAEPQVALEPVAEPEAEVPVEADALQAVEDYLRKTTEGPARRAIEPAEEPVAIIEVQPVVEQIIETPMTSEVAAIAEPAFESGDEDLGQLWPNTNAVIAAPLSDADLELRSPVAEEQAAIEEAFVFQHKAAAIPPATTPTTLQVLGEANGLLIDEGPAQYSGLSDGLNIAAALKANFGIGEPEPGIETIAGDEEADFAPLASIDPAAGLIATPKLDDFDVALEVERLLRGRKWEQRNGPFSGFQSPPGRF